jgi:dTDP-4-amino-4,6-dideoxygalactose transaminase
MITVTKTYLPSLDNYVRQLKNIWRSGRITNNGPLACQLSDELKDYLGVSNIEVVANGTLALQFAIRALELHGEIITTPYSYVATTNAILWEGCDPVFVDIEDKNFCINPELIEAAVTEKTTAILATHVYGYPCDVVRIQKIAKKHKLKVIYDAAHAFGVRLSGKSLLVHGDCSALSFHATKLFHTAEGGAVICKNAQVSKRIFLMKKFGHIGEEKYLDIGVNAKMSELHAAMGICLLPHIDELISRRAAIFLWYQELLDGSPVQIPDIGSGVKYNYPYYPVIFPSHNAMMRARQALLKKNIVPRRYFYPSLNTLPFLRPELKRACPVSENISSRVLCLPIYNALQKKDVKEICSIITGEKR